MQSQVPRMKQVMANIVGAVRVALPRQAAVNISLFRPLRGASAPTTAIRTIARTSVRATALCACSTLPAFGARYLV